MLEHRWRIVLFNGLSVSQGQQTFHRFRTQKTGELLAYLALNQSRTLTRDELADAIWGDSHVEAARTSLRTALASLRRQLELPGTETNSVLYANRTVVRLQPDAFTTDVAEFEAACRDADSPEAPLSAQQEAVRRYSGDLLPGCYADWATAERERLHQAYQHALRQLLTTYWKSGEQEKALELTSRLIAADPLREESYLLKMRLYAALGRRSEALRCFERWKCLLLEELGESPSPAVCALATQMQEANDNRPDSSLPGLLLDRSPVLSAAIVEEQAHLGSKSIQGDMPAVPAERAPVLPPIRLPLALTRFFGRELEISEIHRLLLPEDAHHHAGYRLVTLTGAGGAGKTRLALEVAHSLTEHAPFAVTFVSLSEVRQSERLLEILAAALRLPSLPSGELLDAIAAHLACSPHLLLLDNFEQLLNSETLPPEERQETTEAATLVYTLLARVPSLRCLITSRQCLEIEGERQYFLSPLSTPTPQASVEHLVEFASIQLFVNRAQAARPDFQLTSRNTEAVARLCARLEGLPLALELAAAWCGILSPAQILERLTERFDWLVSRRKGRLSRHQTLWAAIEWSYRLLAPDLQSFFLRLSIFRGGWTAEAAEALSEEPNALEALQALRDRSLIMATSPPNGTTEAPRFSMLEMLREFAWAQLGEAERMAVRHRHADYYVGWLEGIYPQLFTPAQAETLDRIQAEYENFLSILEYPIVAQDDAHLALRLVSKLWSFWSMRGRIAEGRRYTASALNERANQDPTPWRAAALVSAGIMDSYGGDLHSAKALVTESLEIYRRFGDQRSAARAQGNLGMILIRMGENRQARLHLKASLRFYREARDYAKIASTLGNLGVLESKVNPKRALTLFEEALRLSRAVHNLSGIAHFLKLSAAIYFAQERRKLACTYFAESLNHMFDLGDIRGFAAQIGYLAQLPCTPSQSACLFGAAVSLNDSTTASPLALEPKITDVRATLGAETFAHLFAQGQSMSASQALTEALEILQALAVSETSADPRR